MNKKNITIGGDVAYIKIYRRIENLPRTRHFNVHLDDNKYQKTQYVLARTVS